MSLISFSQKRIAKTITIPNTVSTLNIYLDKVFTISLNTHNKDIITFSATSEGEYANHFVVTEKTTDTIIDIKGRIAFTFPNNQDKLSAHKVHAISITITVPERLLTYIKSDIGNLNAQGTFKILATDFLSGNCYLENTSGNINIQTVNGTINLIAKNGFVNASTKKGILVQEKIPSGKSSYSLKSINGNINVIHSK